MVIVDQLGYVTILPDVLEKNALLEKRMRRRGILCCLLMFFLICLFLDYSL